MKSFYRLSLVATLATYLLIFIGGLVRVSGAGLGCPDWPHCFGSWIPPLSIQDLPPGFDPATFNLTLAWIEYINRLSGMIVGLLIAATAVSALIHTRKYPAVMWSAIAAAILVAIQGWYGSIVVGSRLQPETVTIHMLLALLIVCLLIYTTVRSSQLLLNQKQSQKISWKLSAILWPLSLVQILVGTQIRGQFEWLREELPLISASQMLTEVATLNFIHITLGIGVTFMVAYVFFKMKRDGFLENDLAVKSFDILKIILVLQIVSGVLMYSLNIPALLQVFHVWLASLFIGLLVIVFISSGKQAADE